MFPLTAELGSGPALWGRVAEWQKKSDDSNHVQRSRKELLHYLKAVRQNTLPDTIGKKLISFKPSSKIFTILMTGKPKGT